MLTISLFVIGMVIGSFLNVLALRFNSGLTILGRSSCSTCGYKLRYRDLVPVLSFVFLKGRCAKCHGKISWQYPVVEFITGLVFATVFRPEWSLLQNTLTLLISCIFIAISVYDVRHKIIPDPLVYLSILLSIALRFVSGGSVLDWLAGPILFGFFVALWFLTMKRAIGFGDSKLALSIGFFLGASGGFSAIILGFWIGALYGVTLILSGILNPLLTNSKKITMKSEIPFAPFMIAGAWLTLIFNFDLLHVNLW